ncbi:MAG TPA: RNA polymerase sigma factor [Anaerolineae bacterium]|nr:RNA polymerase sigma factor [Anaerolineae bacterium]
MSELDELVQRCKQGELAAFTQLFRDHEAWLYRLAVTILQNEHDAEDALQDAYIRIFERINKFRGKSAFKTWMTAIMVNVCRDRLRRRKVRRALPLDWLGDQASGGDVVRDVRSRIQRQKLWALVDRLDDKHRLAVILHYHEGWSCGEVADMLAVRTSTIYSRLNTARAQLRTMLQTASRQGIERSKSRDVEKA